MLRKVIIDTDPGVDDTLAILFAAGMPHIEISGLSSCMGNTNIEKTHRNLLFIAHSLPECPAVFKGAESPRTQLLTEAVVHGDECMGNIHPLLGDNKNSSAISSTDGVVSILRNSTAKVTVIALAPLTNIAAAMETAPDAFSNCEHLIVLGGAFRAPGNKSKVAEFNFYVDPEAADIVLASRLCPITIIPLDVCFQAVLQLDDLSEILDPNLKDFLHNLCVPYVKGNAEEEGIDGIIMYDPLAVFCAEQPDAFEYEDLYVRVKTGNQDDRGMSKAEWTPTTDTPQPNVRVATNVNFELFRGAFFNSLNRVLFNPTDPFVVSSGV